MGDLNKNIVEITISASFQVCDGVISKFAPGIW